MENRIEIRQKRKYPIETGGSCLQAAYSENCRVNGGYRIFIIDRYNKKENFYIS